MKLGYVDRGDPGAWDFTLASGLTADGAWHNTDLSAIVTDDNAVAVYVWMRFRDADVGMQASCRKDGQVNEHNSLAQFTSEANIYAEMSGWVALGPGQMIEHKIDTGMNEAHIVIRAWM